MQVKDDSWTDNRFRWCEWDDTSTGAMPWHGVEKKEDETKRLEVKLYGDECRPFPSGNPDSPTRGIKAATPKGGRHGVAPDKIGINCGEGVKWLKVPPFNTIPYKRRYNRILLFGVYSRKSGRPRTKRKRKLF